MIQGNILKIGFLASKSVWKVEIGSISKIFSNYLDMNKYMIFLLKNVKDPEKKALLQKDLRFYFNNPLTKS